MYQQCTEVQATHEAWEAAGEQLLHEEQQASAKATAKKAKKLRQKTNRQQAQQAAATAASCSLHVHTMAHPAAPPSSIEPESSHDAGVPVSPPSGLQHQQPFMPCTTPAADAEQPLHHACSKAGRAVEASACCGGAAHQVSEASQQAGFCSLPSNHAQGCADEDKFLQDLFKCPITQVSQSISTRVQPVCGTFRHSCRLLVTHTKNCCCRSAMLVTYSRTCPSPASLKPKARNSCHVMLPMCQHATTSLLLYAGHYG